MHLGQLSPYDLRDADLEVGKSKEDPIAESHVILKFKNFTLIKHKLYHLLAPNSKTS